MKMKRKKNKRKRKKKVKKLSSFQRGLKIGCINVRGIVSYPIKRIDLNNFLNLHNLDALCIQEWYVPQQKKSKKNKNNTNNNNNNINKNDNVNDNVNGNNVNGNDRNDGNDGSDTNNEMGLLAPLKVSLDMTSLTIMKRLKKIIKLVYCTKQHQMSLDLIILMKLM